MANNKVALVTGSSRGLGKNMVIAIAKKGLDTILTYNGNKEKAIAIQLIIGNVLCKGRISVNSPK